jgi:hypothetical protein
MLTSTRSVIPITPSAERAVRMTEAASEWIAAHVRSLTVSGSIFKAPVRGSKALATAGKDVSAKSANRRGKISEQKQKKRGRGGGE